MKIQPCSALLVLLAGCGSQSAVVGERYANVDGADAAAAEPDTKEPVSVGGPTKPDAGSNASIDSPRDTQESAATDSTTAAPSAIPTDDPVASVLGGPEPVASDSVASGPDSVPESGASASAVAPPPSYDAQVELHESCEDTTPVGVAADLVVERLSQLFGIEPDAELLEAAAAGELGTFGQVECQALRLVKLPEAALALRAFIDRWLEIEAWPFEMNAQIPAEVGTQMRAEASAFIDAFVHGGETSFARLLSGDQGWVGPELAAHYGVDYPGSDDKAWVSVPGRVGLLSLGMFTGSLNRIGWRGYWVTSRLQCLAVPPEPEGGSPLEAGLGLTFRETYERSVDSAACAGCHSIVDGPGFGLEQFDATGVFRTDEAGATIDTQGYLYEQLPDGSRAMPQEFEDASGLMARLTENSLVAHCIALRALDYAVARDQSAPLTDAQERARAKVHAIFQSRGQDLKQLLVAVTQTDVFWQ